MIRRFFCCFLFVLSVCGSHAQDFEWQSDVVNMLGEFLTCGGPTPPNTPCNTFLGQALQRVYRIKDFDKPGGGYMQANDIAAFVMIHPELWTLLGEATSQKALNEAQGYANVKKAVIAVLKNPDGHGHVALILPGVQQHSGKWNLDCPNSASFFLDSPSKSYVSKHLAFAFLAPANVKIYGRNF